MKKRDEEMGREGGYYNEVKSSEPPRLPTMPEAAGSGQRAAGSGQRAAGSGCLNRKQISQQQRELYK